MSDAERRRRTRNAQASGSIDDLLSAMHEDVRAGCTPDAIEKARQALMLDSNRQDARDVIKKYNPLEWTGYATLRQSQILVYEPGRTFTVDAHLLDKSSSVYALSRMKYDTGALVFHAHAIEGGYGISIECEITPISEQQNDRCVHRTPTASFFMGDAQENEAGLLEIELRLEHERQNLTFPLTGRRTIIIENQIAYFSRPTIHCSEGHYRGAHITEQQGNEGTIIPSKDVCGRRLPETLRVLRKENRVSRHEDLAFEVGGNGSILVEVPITVIDTLYKAHTNNTGAR